MNTKKNIKKRTKTRKRKQIKKRTKTRKRKQIKPIKPIKNKKAKGPTSAQRSKKDIIHRLKEREKRVMKNAIKRYRIKRRKRIRKIEREKKLENEKKEFIETLKKELEGAKTLSDNEIKIGERLADKFDLHIDVIVKILQDLDRLTIEQKKKIIEKIQVLDNIINNINNTSIGTEFVDELLSNSNKDAEKITNLLEKIKKISIKRENMDEIEEKIDLMFNLLNELYDIIDDLLLDEHYAYDDLSAILDILTRYLNPSIKTED